MFDLIESIFSGAWNMLQIKYPGFDFSIAAVLIGAFCAVLGLRVLGNIFGFSFHLGSMSQRGGNNRDINVSDSRRGDER